MVLHLRRLIVKDLFMLGKSFTFFYWLYLILVQAPEWGNVGSYNRQMTIKDVW